MRVCCTSPNANRVRAPPLWRQIKKKWLWLDANCPLQITLCTYLELFGFVLLNFNFVDGSSLTQKYAVIDFMRVLDY